MSDLFYSAWHRTLGYGYFAMDIDCIEIRNNHPVGVIETSLCTQWYRNCDGVKGVFNRFLQETGGFQIELAWWVAKWLDVPAFVVCLGDTDGKIHILSLVNGTLIIISEMKYLNFLNKLGSDTPSEYEITLIKNPKTLPELLESFKTHFPGIKRYPYFSNLTKWMEIYKKRLHEVNEEIPRDKPANTRIPNNSDVKKETTYTRPNDYLNIRSKTSVDYFNLHWVEWRKDSYRDLIGRPASLIRTILATNIEEFDALEKAFRTEKEFCWWNNCAEKMNIPFYSVYYNSDSISSENGTFKVFEYSKEIQQVKIYNRKEYTIFICSL